MKSSIKLKLKIKDVEIELTKNEIKDLKSILDDIFPTKEVVKEYYPYYPYNPSGLKAKNRWYYDGGTALTGVGSSSSWIISNTDNCFNVTM